jgi:hypothetical protein
MPAAPIPGPVRSPPLHVLRGGGQADTEIMMTRAIKTGIPMIIGSAGTSGSDTGLAWMVDIVREIAREQDLHFNFASFIRNYRETSSVGIFATAAREHSLRRRAGIPHIVTPIIVFGADCSRYGENPTRSGGREKFSAPLANCGWILGNWPAAAATVVPVVSRDASGMCGSPWLS